MKFNLATESDIDEICALVKSAISNMDRNDIFQWDEIYPTREDFLSDIKSGNLYTGIAKNAETTGEKIAVVFALNKCQDEAYKIANWTYNESGNRKNHAQIYRRKTEKFRQEIDSARRVHAKSVRAPPVRKSRLPPDRHGGLAQGEISSYGKDFVTMQKKETRDYHGKQNRNFKIDGGGHRPSNGNPT